MPDALSGTPLNSAAAIGVEMEKLKDNVYAQFNQDDLFLTRVPVRNDLKVSGAPLPYPLARSARSHVRAVRSRWHWRFDGHRRRFGL